MNSISKKLVSLLLVMVLMIGMAIPMASASDTAAWIEIGGKIKCYTISAGNTTTYTSPELTTRSGYVDGNDEIVVKIISRNSKGNWYALINYKVNSGGTKDAYVPLSAVCTLTSVQAGVEKRAGARITNVYKRPGVTYSGSSIDAGDDVYVIGTNSTKTYTQVMYPVTAINNSNPGSDSCVWKLAWIKTIDAQHNLVSKQKWSSWSGTEYGRGYEDDTGEWYTATIGTSGCGLLAIVNAVYYLNGSIVPPEVVASYAITNGYRINGSGTKSTLAGSFCKYSNRGQYYGITCVRTFNLTYYGSSSAVLAEIKPYLLGQKGGHGKCTAVVNVIGHFVAIVDYNSSTNQYLVFDSAANNKWTNVNCLRWMTPSEFTGSMRIAGLGSAYEVAIIGRN